MNVKFDLSQPGVDELVFCMPVYYCAATKNGNVLKNNSYPLSVSAERLSQALHIAEHVKKLEADAVAHGSTGAGNDQVRFDMIFHIMIPGVEIITPIRDMKLSRQEEIDYLVSKGVSINQGNGGSDFAP